MLINLPRHPESKRIRAKILLGVITACGAFFAAGDVRAGDWMFKRSYFSHAPPPDAEVRYPLPHSRSAYRPAMTGTQPGFAVRGGFRRNQVIMQSGNSFDRTVILEDWYNFRP